MSSGNLWELNFATLPSDKLARIVDVTDPASTKIRFGAYEVDRISGELRKFGLRIKLQEQAFQILILMLDHAGELIAREQLREHLWPSGTYVDFEHSLNAAIAKLRQALNDSAENPRFIETISRRGYRFIAPLERLDPTPPATAKPIAVEQPPSGPIPALPAGRRVGVSGLAVLGVVVLGIVAIVTFRRPPENNALLTRVTSDSGLAKDPVISTDGKLIAYASDRKDGKNLDIWIQQVDPEGDAVRLTANQADEHQPRFAPDGTYIIFRSSRMAAGSIVFRLPVGSRCCWRWAAATRSFLPTALWLRIGLGGPSVGTRRGQQPPCAFCGFGEGRGSARGADRSPGIGPTGLGA